MPRFCANLSMMYNEVGFLERFSTAAADGFKGVEYLFPYAFPAEEIAARLEEHELTQVLFNLPPGDWDKGERGVACLPDRTAEFEDGLPKALAYAEATGCRMLHCMAGVVPEGVDRAEAHRTFVRNLELAADACAERGITLLVEPINRFDIPGYFLATVGQALAVIDEVEAPNLKLQYDLYHQQRTGGELVATFQRHKDRIAHVQVAGNPGRHEPDSGEVDHGFVFERLDEAGYGGWVGCEYKPKGGTSEGLGWFQKYKG